MTIVDASLVADALRSTNSPAQLALTSAAGPLAAPELVDLEVASAYRKLVAAGALTPDDGRELLERLRVLPLDRHAHRPLLSRVWSLRSQLSAYDAAYVALAEQLGGTLITRDDGFAKVAGIKCAVTVIA